MAGLLEYTKNGQVTDPPLYRFMKGNVQSFLNSIPDPSKMTPEEQLALGANINPIMGLLGATAYHGSPYLFDKFDIDKVGTGQGTQSYGQGMYFSENPKVADYFKDRLFPTKEFLQAVDKGEYNDLHKFVTKGNLYKVDIPDKDIPKMLQWDKPFNKQTTEVQGIVKNIWKENNIPGDLEKLTGENIYRSVVSLTAAKRMAAGESTSMDLSNYGIKGIKYLDAANREAGKGTSNYVVFDPSNVKILERNNQGLLK